MRDCVELRRYISKPATKSPEVEGEKGLEGGEEVGREKEPCRCPFLPLLVK
jgi:hypothetical protein